MQSSKMLEVFGVLYFSDNGVELYVYRDYQVQVYTGKVRYQVQY